MSEVYLEKTHDHHHADPKAEAIHIDNLKFAMWLYLASEVVLFATLIAVFVVFRINNPERIAEVHEAAGLGGMLLVAFNTFLLLTSSWTMVMGLRAIQGGDRQQLGRWFTLTAALGAAFVGLQYVEYSQLAHEGITLYSDAFGMRFYAPTAFHGAHVVVGVLWALYILMKNRRGVYSSRNYIGIEIFGLFWHFVDVVWILLFTVIYLV